jgi:hypothetical protein
MTNEIRQTIRLVTGGAVIGGGIGGTLISLVNTMLVGLQPVVFIACGVYAGMVYGGVVGAMPRTAAFKLAAVRSRVD